MLIRLRTTPNVIGLVLAAALIGWGDYFTYGMYSPTALRLVVIGVSVLVAALVAGARARPPTGLVVAVSLVALLVWQAMALVRATTYYGGGHWIHDARFVSIALPTVAAVSVAASRSLGSWFWRVLLVGFAVGCLFAIAATPRPSIDVWYLLQHATSCVTHGCNPYTMRTPASPGVRDGFNYLPMSFVLLMPFHVLFGDVRYGEMAAVVVAAVLLRRLTPRQAPNLVALFLCAPGLFFAVEQAWTELVLIALLVAAVWWGGDDLKRRHRWLGTGLLLGVALATKQHVWLLLPVAAVTLGLRAAATALVAGAALTLPWFLAGPHSFWRGTVTTFLDVPPRIDALSLWLHEPAGAGTALAVGVLAVAYVLVWLSCRGTPHRFLLGAGVVLAGFDLMNKQSFYNQWVLVTWLLVAAAALEGEHRVCIVAREA